MRAAPTRLPLEQCTNAGRLPASSRTASSSRPNVASLTAPCPTGMWRYSSPAWTTASGVLNGRGSMASRMSITTAQPARFSAARCSAAGCPPVTIPWIGSQALGTPAMASRSWLIAMAAARFRRSIYLMPGGIVSLTMRSGALVALVSLCTAPVVSGQTPAAPPRAPKVTGYLQGRFQSIGDSALFLLRRARLGAEGNLTTWATYKLQAELRTGGTGATTTTVGATDLYLGLAHGQWSGRVGQFKTPFSRELLQGDDQGELPERSVVVDSLAPSRDVGFMAEWKRVRRLTVQG